jgi:hypothetical protein
MNWLQFNFEKLTRKVKDTTLSEEKTQKFNLLLLDLYELINLYQQLETTDFKFKQDIYAMILKVDQAVDKASKTHFKKFYRKSL